MRRALAAAFALAAAALSLLPAAAAAHVTVQPASAPAGGFARLDVRVPNERADADTVKVDVQLPPGVITASYEPVPGWTVKLTRERLDTPAQTEDGFEVDEQIEGITWIGRGPDGGSRPAPSATSGSRCGCRRGSRATSKALQPTTTARWCAGSGPRTPTSRRPP